MPIPTAPWIAIAQAEHGIAENSLPRQHNERIIEYHATTTLKATDDETAWCSSFVNWVMLQSGRRGTNSAAAMSWLKWGKELPSPRLGAVVVIKKTGATSDASTGSTTGYHVGFATGIAAKSVTLLGGNQLNRVNYRHYGPPVWEVKGWRWPLM